MSPWSKLLALAAVAVTVGPVAGQSDKADKADKSEKPDALPYLHFASRDDRVELDKTRGALDLQKPFTIELWARWDTDVIDKLQYLAGDEAWTGMSDKVPATGASGWAIRTSKVKDANKQAIEFIVAAGNKKKRDWLSVYTTYQKVEPGQWQHFAVCRTASELRVYWNGKYSGKQALSGVELLSAPSNMYLGVREHGFEDRVFAGDIRAFRMSTGVRYGEKFTPDARWEKDDKTVVLLDAADATDASVPDASGNKRDGLITGAKVVKPTKK